MVITVNDMHLTVCQNVKRHNLRTNLKRQSTCHIHVYIICHNRSKVTRNVRSWRQTYLFLAPLGVMQQQQAD
jgi:hypothetical protein